jgi:class 3 adenylate cyclase
MGSYSNETAEKFLNSAQHSKDYWKIVSYVPPKILYANSTKFFNRLILVYIPLMILIGIGSLKLAFTSKRRRLAERRLKEQYVSYARFVPEEFLKLLNKHRLTDIKLADHIQQEITLFFSDIRSYTQLSETMSPKETFHFLNTYFKEVDPVIKKNSGFIDKFIGDAIMAIFPESPHDALSSVIEIKHQLDIYNEGRKSAGYSPIQVGFGLHCGEVTLGTVGTLNRMQTTVIGDTVNLASRIESLTKVFKVDIILSDCVYERLPQDHSFNIREIDTVRVRGIVF